MDKKAIQSKANHPCPLSGQSGPVLLSMVLPEGDDSVLLGWVLGVCGGGREDGWAGLIFSGVVVGGGQDGSASHNVMGAGSFP